MLLPLAGFALLGLPPAADAVTAQVEALLTAPDDPVAFAIPILLGADPLAYDPSAGLVRCLADAGDVSGDGVPDVLVGQAPRTGRPVLAARSGVDGALLWSRALPGDPAAGFRDLRALAVRDGRVAAAPSSHDGSVHVFDAADGSALWSRALAPSAPADPALLHAVAWLDDLDGDGLSELAVAGGHRVDALYVLSGADGSTLWFHHAADVVYDVRVAHDQDGDGVADLAVVGGDDTPFARLLSAATGALLWHADLDGPGACVLPMDDVDGDGAPDLAVGQFNDQSACLLALAGDDGARLWSSFDVRRNVTSLDLLGDMLDTGLRDIAVGSFDNAVSGILALNGIGNWRREGSTFNTGAMLSVDVTGDLDANGQLDVLAASVDRQLYVIGGGNGQYMAGQECRARLSAVLALGDGDGDGRPEMAAGGRAVFWLYDGNAGTADGPELQIKPAVQPDDDTLVTTWAYPGTFLMVFISTGTGALALPGYGGTFGLDTSAFAQLYGAFTPGAGGTPLIIPPQPALSGVQLWLQAVTVYAPGSGWFSNVGTFVFP